MTRVSLDDVVNAARAAGLHLNRSLVYVAVDDGDLDAVSRGPLEFERAEANRWLNALARSQGVRPSRHEQRRRFPDEES